MDMVLSYAISMLKCYAILLPIGLQGEISYSIQVRAHRNCLLFIQGRSEEIQ